jgi:anaphase-promoting complex subunit 2
MKLLELLKTRFGEAPLQSCEVMIKDIQDSRRVDGVIRRNQKLDPSAQEIAAARQNADMLKQDHTSPEGLLKPSLHAKILSRLFWPQLHHEDYRVPDDIVQLQKSYEQGFESLKNSRKLTWLQGLGQATVELELQDRVVLEEVHTWQATVIWAFQSDEGEDSSTTKSVWELVEHLEMDETLVRSALKFWAGKMVLREIRKDEYTVLETLNQEDRARSDAQAVAAVTATESSTDDNTLMSNEDLTSEKMQMYWQFIQGMLTNSSPQMPLQQIAMMLKMLIVDGFPYSNEELQEFLSLKVAAGELDFVAGKYKLKK